MFSLCLYSSKKNFMFFMLLDPKKNFMFLVTQKNYNFENA
jgi:hypothetical protein